MSLISKFVLLGIFCLISATSFAQSVKDGVLINAKFWESDMEKGITYLRGGVQLVFQGQHLSCDRAELNQKTQTITAIGHVILSNERVHVEGDRIIFNYKQNTGLIYNGFVQSGQVVFEGDVIQKVSETRYLANNADYTACDTCPPGWSFSGRNIDAELGGYARIKRPVFKIAGFPILILPSLIVPLKSARQSGFLVPTMDRSDKGGLAVGASYFWAIDRSRDVTLTTRWYEFRGYKVHEDFRYMLSENSRGQLKSAWINDRAVRTPEFGRKTALNRYFVDFESYSEMPDKFVHRADINMVSDLRYPRDFPDEVLGHGEPALQSRTSISRTGDDTYMSAEADIYTNMLKSYPLAPNDDAVHRFPEVRYSIKETQLFENGPYFSFDLDYINYVREKFNYDDLQLVDSSTRLGLDNNASGVGANSEIVRDGVFNSGLCTTYPCKLDLNRTGQRLDLRPTVIYPFQIGRLFDVLPAVSFRETQYRFYLTDPNFGQTAARRYVQTDLRVKTEFARVYGDLTDPKAKRWKHSIEPEIGYSHIPWMRKPNHPFFGDFEGLKYSRQFDPVSDADLTNPNTGLQFDYEDRTYQRQAVDLAITNRLTQKFFSGDAAQYFNSVFFRLSQAYDLIEARSGRRADGSLPHPWSPITAQLNMRFDRFETYTTAIYNMYANRVNTTARLRVMTSASDFLQLSYSENAIINERDEVQDTGRTKNIGLGAGFRLKYMDAVGEVNFNDLTKEIQSWGYVLNLRPPGNCWIISIEHKQIVSGDKQIRGSLAFNFGGEVVQAPKTPTL
ncbi:MAG: LPS assembly protein LptD [Bdellovibrionales bacterium]|nr:LPS assembly protein LptD [Bdellovibrionales bacterium]